MSTPSSWEQSENEACLRCCRLDTRTLLRRARAKLLRGVIDGSSLSAAAKVMLSTLVDEDLPEAVQAAAENLTLSEEGTSAPAHLLRGVVQFERGSLTEARRSFSLASCRGAAWLGYGLLATGPARTAALERAFELDPSLVEDKRTSVALGPALGRVASKKPRRAVVTPTPLDGVTSPPVVYLHGPVSVVTS